jgi:hypothetical protein
MTQAYTTREQSRILIGYGLPKESADVVFYGDGVSEVSTTSGRHGVPAWSTARLMELLPDKLISKHIHGYRHFLFIEKNSVGTWNVGYEGFTGKDKVEGLSLMWKANLTEALFELVCNLLIQGYKLMEV